MKNLINTLLIVIITSSCTSKTTEVSFSSCKTIDVKIEISYDNYNLNKIFDLERIELETTKESLIGTISKAYLTNEYIYILDNDISQALFRFKRDGSFINKISKKGRGVGESLSVDDFDISPKKDELYLYSGNEKKIMVFNLTGEYIREVIIDEYGYSLKYLESTGYITVGSKGLYNAIFWNHKGKKIKVYKDDRYSFISRMGKRPISLFADNYLLNFPYDNCIYLANDKTISPYLKINFLNHNFPLCKISNREQLKKKNSPDFALIKSAMLFDKDILLQYSYQKMLHYCLIPNKETQEMQFFQNITIDNFPFTSIVGESAKHIIFSMPSDLIYHYTKNKPNTHIDSEVSEFYKNIELNSNPIIVVAKYKKSKSN